MSPPIEDLPAERLKSLLDAGEIVIFARRDAETLQKIAAFFDLVHDDGNFQTLKEIIKAWQRISALGAFGRLLLYAGGFLLTGVAAIAAITGRWPWIADVVTGHPAK